MLFRIYAYEFKFSYDTRVWVREAFSLACHVMSNNIAITKNASKVSKP